MAFVYVALVHLVPCIFCLVIFISNCLAAPPIKDQIYPSYEPTDSQVQNSINQLSLPQKVSQLFIFGFTGKEYKTQLKKLIQTSAPGSIIAFKRNVGRPHQVAKMNQDAQNLAIKLTGLPLFIMVDQEGGTVTRIKMRPLPPSALSIGMTKQPKLAMLTGRVTGQLLSYLGFNMNLAPVLDLSDPFTRNFIGNRSFGGNPNVVKVMATNFALGLSAAGIIPAGKHFPGHGGILSDSHKVLPTKMISLEALKKNDLIPFEYFANQKMFSAIMVAHVAFPKLDPTGLPATYSSALIKGILRNELKYDGLIITDDIEMKGAQRIGGVGKRAVKAIEAGCDMVMVAWSKKRQGEALKAVIKAVELGDLSLDRIHESLQRIVRIKLRNKNKGISKYYGRKTLKENMKYPLRTLRKITKQIAHNNLGKSLRGYSFLKGTLENKSKLVVFSADPKLFYPIKKLFNLSLDMKFHVLRSGQKEVVQSIIRDNPDSVYLFYVSGQGTARILEGMPRELKKNVIAINTTYPATLAHYANYRAVINIYSRNYLTGGWLTEYLFGNEDKLVPVDTRKPAKVEPTIN